MQRYLERSITKSVGEWIFRQNGRTFSHQELLQERNKAASMFLANKKKVRILPKKNELYYQFVSNVKQYLLDIRNVVLISIRGIGYKKAEGHEMLDEGFKKLEATCNNARYTDKVCKVAHDKELTYESKVKCMLMASHSRRMAEDHKLFLADVKDIKHKQEAI